MMAAPAQLPWVDRSGLLQQLTTAEAAAVVNSTAAALVLVLVLMLVFVLVLAALAQRRSHDGALWLTLRCLNSASDEADFGGQPPPAP